MFSFLNRVQFIKFCRPVFYNSLIHIITNKWFFLPLFAASPPIFTSIASPFFADLWPPYNIEPIIHLSTPCLKEAADEYFHNILGAMKFKVHLHNFSEVSTRSGCGVTLYLGTTREASHIFYVLILLFQSLFYSLISLFHWKWKILSLF